MDEARRLESWEQRRARVAQTVKRATGLLAFMDRASAMLADAGVEVTPDEAARAVTLKVLETLPNGAAVVLLPPGMREFLGDVAALLGEAQTAPIVKRKSGGAEACPARLRKLEIDAD